MRLPLFFVLVGLTLSTAALAQTQMPPVCGLREPPAPRPRGHGVILEVQDPAIARAHIPSREMQRGGPIDPRYLNDQRARVRQDNGIIDTFDILPGMTVRAGDRVKLQGSYRSGESDCSYVPHMIVPGDAPSA